MVHKSNVLCFKFRLAWVLSWFLQGKNTRQNRHFYFVWIPRALARGIQCFAPTGLTYATAPCGAVYLVPHPLAPSPRGESLSRCISGGKEHLIKTLRLLFLGGEESQSLLLFPSIEKNSHPKINLQNFSVLSSLALQIHIGRKEALILCFMTTPLIAVRLLKSHLSYTLSHLYFCDR